jgi:hypothetical protein
MKTPATSIPLAVALRSMLAENEAKIAAAPGKRGYGAGHRVGRWAYAKINNSEIHLPAYRARWSNPARLTRISPAGANVSLPVALPRLTHPRPSNVGWRCDWANSVAALAADHSVTDEGRHHLGVGDTTEFARWAVPRRLCSAQFHAYDHSRSRMMINVK